MALTALQMANELWEMLGEPSDIDPSTAAGFAKILRWLNEAQLKISTYVYPDGHVLRFPTLYDKINYQTVRKTGTLIGATSSTAIFNPADSQIGTDTDQYADWLIETTGGTGEGQIRLIASYDGATKTATLVEDWDTTPDGSTTFSLFKRFVKVVDPASAFASENLQIDPKRTMVYPLRIDNLSSKQELTYAEGKETTFLSTIDQAGTPTQWIYYGDSIIFDYAPDESIWLRIEYYRKPTPMTAEASISELPDDWGMGIILGARWWGFMRGQESTMSYSAKRDLEGFMVQTRQMVEMRYERLDGGIVLEVS